MTRADRRIFVDTNILLRATITQFPHHEQAKELVSSQIEASTEAWISRQVVREYISQATRPQLFAKPMTIAQVEKQITGMRAIFKIADETERVMEELIELLKQNPTAGKQVHDANIVATMIVYGIDTLLTANVADMKRFENRIHLIPLAMEEM